MLLSLAKGLQELLYSTVSSCPQVFGLDKETESFEQTYLCRYLLASSESKQEGSIARGYYGTPAYPPYFSGFDPLTVLAGLAFLAFLLQTLHALLYRSPPTALTPVSISRASKESFSLSELLNSIVTAFEKYDEINKNSHSKKTTTPSTMKTVMGYISRIWMAPKNSSCYQDSLCTFMKNNMQNILF